MTKERIDELEANIQIRIDNNDSAIECLCAAHEDEEELIAEVRRLRAALAEIAERRGPFSRDTREHAGKCIAHMGEVADGALDGTWLPEDE